MSYRLLGEFRPIARKAHKCIWCGEAITAGERYLRERSVCENGMQNFAWHFACNNVAQNDFKNGDCEFTAYNNDRAEAVQASIPADDFGLVVIAERVSLL